MQETESKAGTQVQGLQAELLRMQREVEAFKAGAQKHDAEVASLSSSCGAATSEAARAKGRAATLEDALAKSEAETRRLQGYAKQLEAAQRAKDAQVCDRNLEVHCARVCMRLYAPTLPRHDLHKAVVHVQGAHDVLCTCCSWRI